jgi:hypothetical protein
MICHRCEADYTTVYFVGAGEPQDEQVCRWCLTADELNQIRTAEAMEEAEP